MEFFNVASVASSDNVVYTNTLLNKETLEWIFKTSFKGYGHLDTPSLHVFQCVKGIQI